MIYRQLRLLNSDTKYSINLQPFYFFKSPLVVNKSNEILRRTLNPIYRFVYRYFFENEFTMNGFINGARQATLLNATLIREAHYDKMPQFMNKSTIAQVKRRTEEIPSDILKKYLTFSEDNIVKTIVHSSFTSSIFLLTRGADSYDFTFYSTFVLYIDLRNTDKTRSLNKLLNDPNVLICNITLGRILIPLGRWRITDINFFSTDFLKNKGETAHLVPLS